LPLTPAAVLAWRLPLTPLGPELLFRQIRHNLQPAGCISWWIMDWRKPVRLADAASQQGCNPCPLVGRARSAGIGCWPRYSLLWKGS